MDKEKLKDLEDVLHAYRLIDQSHDRQLISDSDFVNFRSKLNDKTHTAINALLA